MPDRTHYVKTARTGGGASALDGIAYASLLDGDTARTFVAGIEDDYIFDDDIGGDESDPSLIKPDDAAANPGRWVRQPARDASETLKGISERATDAEAVTGEDTERHVTPAGLTARLAAPGTIGGTTPGLVRGKIDTIIQAATDTLTAAECSGTEISNYGQAEANTQTLPTAAEGLGGLITIATAGAGAFNLKAGGNDKIYLDGTALDDGDKVSLAAPALGDFFTYFAFKSGNQTYDWIVRSGQGTLTDGGA